MNCKKTILTLIALSLLAGLGFGLRLTAADPLERPLIFRGYFENYIFLDTKIMEFNVDVRTSQNQPPEGIMTFMGERVTPQRPGEYKMLKMGCEPQEGTPIIMTFQSNAVGSPLYTARVEAFAPIRFTNPKPNAHIHPAHGSMLVSWTGGNPPYTVHLVEGNDPRGRYMWIISHVNATSLFMPLVRGGDWPKLIPGNKYCIVVVSTKKECTFNFNVEQSSRIVFNQIGSISFFYE